MTPRKSAGRAPECPVHGLDHEARLDPIRGKGRLVDALTEQGPGCGQDVAARLLGLLRHRGNS